MKQFRTEELLEKMEGILQSPMDRGIVRMIIRRPGQGKRESLEIGELTTSEGLVGDNWNLRGSSKTEDGLSHPGMQLTLINSRVIAAIAGSRTRWSLAGDQVFVDLDLSAENLPPGTQLKLGTAVVEISNVPHTGCKKFREWFGLDALLFVGSEMGREKNFRGIYAIVVKSGQIAVGEMVQKIEL